MKKFIAVSLCVLSLLACGKKPIPEVTPPGGGSGTNPEQPGDKPTGKDNLFISPDGNDDNNGKSSAFPVKTFAKVLTLLKPGVTVNIMPGTYEATGSAALIELKPEHSGTEDAPITFKSYKPDQKAVLKGSGERLWTTVKVRASYIVFEDLEFAGNVQSLDSAAAYNGAKSYYENGGDINALAKYNTNGISFDGDENRAVVHDVIRNCIVHDFPGGGIGASYCDYITIENNLVYRNAWTTMYACSGISIINPVNTDASTDHKLIVSGNTCFDNKTMVPWYRGRDAQFKNSDGNGIIIDINNREYKGGPYKGRTLVINNVSYWNGGSGIHAYSADHVDIVNNTAYMNGKKYKNGEYGDIYAHGCTDVKLMNNIMYARPDGDCNKKGKAATSSDPGIMYYNNLMFNGKTYTDASYFKDGKIADPLFVKPGTTLDADFRLKADSPAKGMGKTDALVPAKDKDGVSRSGRVDAGAYQVK